MASEKLSNLTNLSGGQVPSDLVYVVDVSPGAGSRRSTLNDLFRDITLNITDGALRFTDFPAPALSDGGEAAIYYDTSSQTVKVSTNNGAYSDFAVLGNAQTFTAPQTFATNARSSGSTPYLTVTAPADTGLTASAEAIGINFNGSATRQHATGAITTQREFVFQAPTYSFVGTSTITTAATLAVTGAPTSGANATITNSYAVLIQTGVFRVIGSTSNSTLQVGTIEVQSESSNINHLGANIYFNGVNFKRRASGFTSQFHFQSGEFTGRLSDTAAADTTPTQIIPLRCYYTGEAGLGGNMSGVVANFSGTAVYVDGATNKQVGINKTTSLAAQLHILSGSASRVAIRADSAASPTVDIAQFTINASTTAGAYVGVKLGGTIFGVRNAVTATGGGITTLNLNEGNWRDVSMPAGNTTIALSNIPNSALIAISITQDATGSRTVTWPSTVKWAGGAAPTLTTTANARDQFLFTADGTNLYECGRALNVS